MNLTSVLLYVLLTQCSLSCKPLWYESVNTANSFPCVVSVEQVTSEECNFGTLHRTNRGFRTAPVQLGSLSANEMLSKVVENVRMMDEHNCMNPIMKSQGQSWTLLCLKDVKLSDAGTADSGITKHLWLSKWLRIPDLIWILQSIQWLFLDYKIQNKYIKIFHRGVVENEDICLKTVYTLLLWTFSCFLFHQNI